MKARYFNYYLILYVRLFMQPTHCASSAALSSSNLAIQGAIIYLSSAMVTPSAALSELPMFQFSSAWSDSCHSPASTLIFLMAASKTLYSARFSLPSPSASASVQAYSIFVLCSVLNASSVLYLCIFFRADCFYSSVAVVFHSLY